MPIHLYLSEIHFGYDDGFTTIMFGFIGSCIGCLFVLLLSYFEFKFKKQNSNL